MFFSLIGSYLRWKERILNVVLIFMGLGQDLTHLAQKENTHSRLFLSGRLKILIAFCSLTALRQDDISHGRSIDFIKSS
jgi:hypothetical protein